MTDMGNNRDNQGEDRIGKEIDSIMQENEHEQGKKKKPKKRRRKKFILIGVPAVILIAAFFILRSMSAGNAALLAVETRVLSKGRIERTISVTGPVQGTDSVDITSSLHSKITEINVKEGDEVTEGVTVLAKIDTEDLSNEVERARGQYDLALHQRDEKARERQNAYNRAAGAQNLAQSNYNRLSALAAEGAISDAELEKASEDLNQANLELSSFKVRGGKVVEDESMEIQVNNAKLELERAEKKLESATLVAPISGTVTRVNTKVGKFADYVDNRNTPLITIEKLDRLEVKLLVSEYSIGKIRIGQKVSVSADILGKDKSVEGEVLSISPSGEIKEGSTSERVIPVTVKISKQESGLISGINAKAEILLEEKENTLVVPISAIGDDGTGQSVMQFVSIEGEGTGSIRILPVSTGIEGEIEIELLEDPFVDQGMDHEARYLTTYNPDLAEGAKIRFESEEAGREQEADPAQESGATKESESGEQAQ